MNFGVETTKEQHTTLSIKLYLVLVCWVGFQQLISTQAVIDGSTQEDN